MRSRCSCCSRVQQLTVASFGAGRERKPPALISSDAGAFAVY